MKSSNILFRLCHSMKALTCWKTEILQSMTISASWRKWWKKTTGEAISLPTEENRCINLKGIFLVQVLFYCVSFWVSGARRVWLLNWRPLPYIHWSCIQEDFEFLFAFFDPADALYNINNAQPEPDEKLCIPFRWRRIAITSWAPRGAGRTC